MNTKPPTRDKCAVPYTMVVGTVKVNKNRLTMLWVVVTTTPDLTNNNTKCITKGSNASTVMGRVIVKATKNYSPSVDWAHKSKLPLLSTRDAIHAYILIGNRSCSMLSCIRSKNNLNYQLQ